MKVTIHRLFSLHRKVRIFYFIKHILILTGICETISLFKLYTPKAHIPALQRSFRLTSAPEHVLLMYTINIILVFRKYLTNFKLRKW